MTEQLAKDGEERLIALMGLAASRTDGSEDCPSDETLARFIDGELKGEGRQALLAHLNRCPACYQHWLAVSDVLKSTAAETKAHQQPSVGAMLAQHLDSLFGSWKLAVPVAAAALVALVVFLPTTRNLGEELDVLYVAQRVDAEVFAQSLEKLPLPWESTTFAFSEAEAPNLKGAFGAGLWDGRAALLNKKTPAAVDIAALPEQLSPPGEVDWAKTRWGDHYQLGRWILLLWTQITPEMGFSDLAAHESALLAFKNRLAVRQAGESDIEETLVELDNLEPLLLSARRHPDSRSYAKLRRRVLLTMQRLAP